MLDSVIGGPWSRVIVACVLIACVVCPGALFLAVFAPELFHSLDSVKVLLLSAAVALPLLFANAAMLVAAGSIGIKPIDSEQAFESFTLKLLGAASLLTMLPLYLPVLVRTFIASGAMRFGIVFCVIVAVVQGAIVGLSVWWCSPPRENESGEVVEHPGDSDDERH